MNFDILFRKALDYIGQAVNRYASGGIVQRDKQDVLAMALLEVAVAWFKDREKYKFSTSGSDDVLDKLSEIDNTLSVFLKENY